MIPVLKGEGLPGGKTGADSDVLIRLFTVLLVELWEETAVPTRCDNPFPMQRISKMALVQKVSKCVEFWRDWRGGRRERICGWRG
jgi:hypothetical protein